MKKTYAGAAAFVLMLVLVFTTAFSIVPAQAASYPTTHPNIYKNTGIGADDIVGVAKTQVGYQENSVGTKYGYWYNKTFVNQPWCAMFVSWCADQANISQEALQKYASCSAEVKWFKSVGRWHDSLYYGGNYTPQKGDVVFYRNSGSSSLSDHTGLVVGINGTYLHVIEGNSTNAKCCEFTTNSSRTLKSSYVIGYGTPAYEGESKPDVSEEPTTYEEWQITDAESLMLREGPSTSTKKLATMSKGKVLKVTEFEMTDDYFWGKTKYSGKDGWCALDYCTYMWGNIDGEYYQMPPTVSPTTVTLYAGATKKLTVKNGLGATYSSSKKAIAKVSKTGKITAVANGAATITCKTNTGKATCKVTVQNPEINEKSAATCIGDTTRLTLTGAYGTVEWTSSDETIATVKDGVVTGVAKGKATITAKVSGVELTCPVTITKDPKTYENFQIATSTNLYEEPLGKKIMSAKVGDVVKVTEVKYTDTYSWGKTVYNDKAGWIIINRCHYINGSIDGKTYKKKAFLVKTAKNIYLCGQYKIEIASASGAVSYKSRNSEIAEVDENGIVIGKKAGTTYIDIENKGTELKCKIKVNNPKLTKTELGLLKGNTGTIKVKGGDGEIVWKSLGKKIATVVDGKITAKSYGVTTIKAIRNDITMTCEIRVYDPVLSAVKKTVTVGKTKTLAVKQSSGEAVKWVSDNKKIVKVNSKGVITGVKAGTATVSATVDGVTLKCTVKVKAAPVEETTAPSSTSDSTAPSTQPATR